jgi:hypothetical protein
VTVRNPVTITGLTSPRSGQFGTTISLAPTVGGTTPVYQW